ncbi:hypothetical protein LXL04_000710 [Taraxacum kok-saghyz]
MLRHLRFLLSIDDFNSDSEETNDVEEPLITLLEIPWFPLVSNTTTSQRRRELFGVKKAKWFFNSTQGNRLVIVSATLIHIRCGYCFMFSMLSSINTSVIVTLNS